MGSCWQEVSKGLLCTVQVPNRLISPILVSEPLAERVSPEILRTTTGPGQDGHCSQRGSSTCSCTPSAALERAGS